MKIFNAVLFWLIACNIFANAQQRLEQIDTVTQSDYFKKLEEGFVYNVQWSYELNLLEQTISYGMARYDSTKVAYKGVVFRHPIHDSSGYKLLFWYANPKPTICAVAHVFLDETDADAIITYGEREPNNEEASICRRMLTTMNSINDDSAYIHLPATYLSLIPLPLAQGGQIIVFQRALDMNTCIFGNDYIFTYSALDSLIGVTKVHDLPTKTCVDTLVRDAANTAVLYHWHSFKSLKNFPITDLASVFLYCGMHHIKEFSLVGDDFIFSIEPATMQMKYLIQDEYYKAIRNIPEKPIGWAL